MSAVAPVKEWMDDLLAEIRKAHQQCEVIVGTMLQMEADLQESARLLGVARGSEVLGAVKAGKVLKELDRDRIRKLEARMAELHEENRQLREKIADMEKTEEPATDAGSGAA